ncbi:3-deoxy-D-manno-octulosonic acid kinase [Tateyamaria omphalii]|uniref:3-deoxy-D-manno-octulosonic acid kinase n=1 Tax=Tateyamaria omphalii TaxID=299262 RepID=UPI00167B133E|nr:3-deoxy-D-manno-octulosonic acid kinase [Tateyamaria omphalii]GGX72809.1 3-deoxy-D-manno-octulosonic acid kinase [Tateyamaria omphalii]
MSSRDLHLNSTVIRFDENILSAMNPQIFDVAWLRSQQLWQDSTAGRSQAHFFYYAGCDMVLRHFHRGGLLGRVNRDLYLRIGAAHSRALREYDLLREMLSEGLPVPLPVAARYVPFGPFYRADIITQRIPNARPLQEVLEDRALSTALWYKIGAHVRTLHDHRVFHSDLNCRNILLDTDDEVWFIDFDKCDKRPPGTWEQGNLDRLRRSLRKTKANMPAAQWHERDWADLLAGYEGG